jgi:tetratricopeptide (TPR) repeat protein
MKKTGRNDPCPCGSGKKYKRCCLQKDEQAQSAALAAAQAAAAAEPEQIDAILDPQEELDELSNSVIDLIDAGKLDEAERAARALLERFPEVHDGYDRLGMVYQARGQHRQAADCYRQVIEFVRNHADDYELGFETTFQKLVEKLDPPATG